MKKVLAFPLAWFWYFVGDLCCKILETRDDNEEWAAHWYPRYNGAMKKSTDAQGENAGRWWPWELANSTRFP